MACLHVAREKKGRILGTFLRSDDFGHFNPEEKQEFTEDARSPKLIFSPLSSTLLLIIPIPVHSVNHTSHLKLRLGSQTGIVTK